MKYLFFFIVTETGSEIGTLHCYVFVVPPRMPVVAKEKVGDDVGEVFQWRKKTCRRDDSTALKAHVSKMPEEIIGRIMKLIDIFDACALRAVLYSVFRWKDQYPDDIYKDVWRNTMRDEDIGGWYRGGEFYKKATPHHNNQIIARVVISWWGFALEDVPHVMKNDKEIVLIAVGSPSWGTALEYASDALKNDKDVVLTAVNNAGEALEYASDTLKNNEEVVMAAIREEMYVELDSALKYASDELRGNKAFVLAAMEFNSNAYEYASYELQEDPDLIRQLMLLMLVGMV